METRDGVRFLSLRSADPRHCKSRHCRSRGKSRGISNGAEPALPIDALACELAHGLESHTHSLRNASSGLLYFARATAWKSTAITILLAGRRADRHAGHFLGYVSRSQAALNKLCANWNWIESGQLYRAIAAPRVTTHDRLSRESAPDSLSRLCASPSVTRPEWSLNPSVKKNISSGYRTS